MQQPESDVRDTVLLRHRWDHRHPLHRFAVRSFNAVARRVPFKVKYGIGLRLRRTKPPYALIGPGDTAVQVGAPNDTLRAGRSRGMYFALRTAGGGRALIVEPDPASAEAFRAVCAQQGLRHVVVHHGGAWSGPGSLTLRVDDRHPATNFTEGTADYSAEEAAAGFHVVEVPSDALDDLIERYDLPKPTVVSVTTNGSEHQILEGLRRTMEQGLPYVCLARTDELESFTPMMRSYGYELYSYDDRGYTFRHQSVASAAVAAPRARAAVVLVGTLPPPITGAALAFSAVVDGLSLPSRRLVTVDMSQATATRTGWRRVLGRVAELVGPLARVAPVLVSPQLDRVYVLVSQSRVGALRDLPFILAGRLRRRPVFCHVHGGRYDQLLRGSRLHRMLLDHPGVTIVLLDAAIEAEVGAVVPRARTAVVGNAAARNPHLDLSRTYEPDRQWRLLYLSNLIRSKGYLDAVEALALARAKGFDCRLTLCGQFLPEEPDETPDSLERDFRSTCSRLGVTDHVEWKGVVDGDEKLRTLAEADAFVLPTYYPNEGQPLSALEALAAGTIPVTTRYRGLIEAVEGIGEFVPPRDPAAIADAVVAIMAAPDDLPARRAAAVHRFEERYTIDRMLANLRSVLLEGEGP